MSSFRLRKYAFLLFCPLCVSLISSGCKKDKSKLEAEQTIKEWVGKRIVFPKDVSCTLFGKDVTSSQCDQLFDSEYKVLLYVDSTGCSDCRLTLNKWKDLMKEADSLMQDKLDFIYFFQPKKCNSNELEFIIRRNGFKHPVFLDVNNQLDSLNQLPKDVAFQCFLLDRNNNVLLIGNPLLNPKVWNLYKKMIIGDKQEDAISYTTIEPNKIVHNFGRVKKGSINKAVFLIKNIGIQPLVLYQVNASCGCTQVDWDKQPICPGKLAKVKVELNIDKTGFFSKRIEVYGNIKSSPLTLKISGIAVD